MKKTDLLMILKGILKGRGRHKKKRNFLYYALDIIFSLILVLALAIWMLMSGIFGSKKDKHSGKEETVTAGVDKDVDKNQTAKKETVMQTPKKEFFTKTVGMPGTNNNEGVELIIQSGHSGGITCLALSRDDKYALSGSRDCTLRLWRTDSGAMIRLLLTGPCVPVECVAFSPDGRYALSGSDVIRLWEVDSGKEVLVFEKDNTVHQKAPHLRYTSVAFSPDGQQVLAGIDNRVELYETFSGKKLKSRTDLKASSLAFSSDGKHVMVGGYGSIVLWNPDTGKEIRSPSVNSRQKTVFSSDGKYAVSGERLWDMTDLENSIAYVSCSTFDTPLTVSSDNKYVLIENGNIRVYNPLSGKKISSFGGHRSIRCAVFSSDGKYVLSGSEDNTIKWWEAASGKEIRSFQGNISGHICSAAFSPDGRYAVAGYENSALMLWDVKSGKGIRSFQGHLGSVTSAVFSAGGRYVLSGGEDKTLRLWDTDSGEQLRNIKGYTSVFNAMLSPDGKYALADNMLFDMNIGKLIRFHDMDSVSMEFSNTGKLIRFRAMTPILSLGFSPDSRCAILAADGVLLVWDVASGKEIRRYKGHSADVRSAEFSPDGKYLLSGSLDKTLKLWDAESGGEIRTFKGHSDGVTCVSFSPDGQYALSGSRDDTLKLWEISSGRPLCTYRGHSDSVTCVDFSPDGQYALSGSRDKSLRLWGLASGAELCRFVLFEDGEWLTLTPQRYYTASAQGHKYLYASVRNTVSEIGEYRKTFDSPDKIREILSSPGKLPMGNFPKNPGSEPVLSKYRAERVSSHTLKIYDRKTGREVFSHTEEDDPCYAHDKRDYGEEPTYTYFQDYALSPDEKYVLLAFMVSRPGLEMGDSRTISCFFQLFEIETGKSVVKDRSLLESASSLESVGYMYFSSDGKFVIASSKDTIMVWDFETGKIVKRLQSR